MSIEKKPACGDYRPRKQITPIDDILQFILGPIDKLARKGWDYLKVNGYADSVSEKIMDFMAASNKKKYEAQYNLTIHGLENLPEGGAILAPNHSSWLDAQVLAPMLPRRAKYFAKAELLEMPLNGIFMEMAGGIPVERLCVESTGLKKAIELLKKDEWLVLFPEGTIPGEEDLSRDDVEPDTGLLPGNGGAIMLAIRTQVPIIPIGIIGTDIALPPEVIPRLEQLPPLSNPKITINVGKPISYSEYFGSKVETETSDKLVHELMLEIGKLSGRRRGVLVE